MGNSTKESTLVAYNTGATGCQIGGGAGSVVARTALEMDDPYILARVQLRALTRLGWLD
jgi:hypothetical protein